MSNNSDVTDKIETQNICKNFLDQVQRAPEQVALRWKQGDDWSQMTYAELSQRVASVAAGLSRLVRKGDRVVLLMTNRPEFHVLDLATLFCGATPISVYNTCAPDQIKSILSASGARVAVVEDELSESFNSVRPQAPGLEHFISIEGANSIADLNYDELTSHGSVDLAELASDVDMACLLYTSPSPRDATLSRMPSSA